MKDRSWVFPIAFAFLLLVAFGLRVYALEADAPHHLSVSQGLTTDGANTVYGGRNKVIFGQWTPEIERFPSVDSSNSAMLWLSYYTFSLLGTGYWQAGFLAVVMGLLTISVVAAFARQHFGQRVALLAAVFLTFNYAFVIYNRLPVAFTMVGLVMALILFAMGRSPGKPLSVLVAIALAVFGFVSVKVAAIASIPMIIVGSSILLYRRYPPKRVKFGRLLLLMGLFAVAAVVILIASPNGKLFLRLLGERTLGLRYGFTENIRFLVVSTLEFGIYSAFFVRMLPLLLFSFGYVLFRVAQLIARKQGNISFGEMMALTYLLGVVGMLMLSNQQPTRHLILLIPPMSLVSAMAMDRILRVERISTAKNLGYLFPIVVFVGLAYLLYQVLAALFRLVVAMGLGTGVGDYSTITPMPILQAIMFVALVPAFLVTFFILALLSSSGDWLNRLYSKRRLGYIVAVLIAILIAGDLFQYLSWAREPDYSIVEASRQFNEDFGDEAVLGGAYAAVLGLENDNPGQLFFEIPLRSPEFQQKVLDSGLTHLAMESSSIFGDIPINDVEMRKNAPEFVKHLHLTETYYVRGYFVRVYEIERD